MRKRERENRALCAGTHVVAARGENLARTGRARRMYVTLLAVNACRRSAESPRKSRLTTLDYTRSYRTRISIFYGVRRALTRARARALEGAMPLNSIRSAPGIVANCREAARARARARVAIRGYLLSEISFLGEDPLLYRYGRNYSRKVPNIYVGDIFATAVFAE